MRWNRFVIVAAALAVILAVGAHWRQSVLERRLREELCRLQAERCLQTCESSYNQELDDIRDDRLREFGVNAERLRDCLRDLSTAAECRASEDTRHRDAERELEVRKKQAVLTRDACRDRCCKEAAQRGCPQCPAGPSLEPQPDRSFDADCIDAPGGPCVVRVSELCQQVSGVCVGCELNLCGDPAWAFAGDSLIDTTLIAGSKPGVGRMLASATAKDGRARLVIPRDIKLEAGEQLQLTFSFSPPAAKTRRVKLHRER